MIKFSATNTETGQPVLGIGLSRANCEKLLAGQPILFNTSGMAGLPALEVFILGGETEEAMALEMYHMGAVTKEQIKEDPGLREPHVPMMKKGGEA